MTILTVHTANYTLTPPQIVVLSEEFLAKVIQGVSGPQNSIVFGFKGDTLAISQKLKDGFLFALAGFKKNNAHSS